MSPEQAAGQPLDARSDIFSLGIVLYELLAGRRPFEAANDLGVLKAIAHAAPAPLPDDVPEFLRIVVDKALEKEPGDRYQTMQELVVDLKRVTRKPMSSQSAVSASDVHVVAGVVKRHPVAVASAAAALVLAVVGATYLALPRFGPPTRAAAAGAPPLGGFEITQLTTSGNAAAPAISPDGRYVAYTQAEPATQFASGLWIRQVATSSNALIVPPEPGIVVTAPTVTPDGTFVDFLRADFRKGLTGPSLWRVPFLGGKPRQLLGNVWSPVGWSPDGRRMAFVRVDVADASSTTLVVADADGGRERVLATRRSPAVFSSLFILGGPLTRPAWSPDGNSIALYEVGARPTPQIVVVDVATGREQSRDSRGGFPGNGIAWLGPDSLLLSQSDADGRRVQLRRMSYSSATVAPLTNDLSSYVGVDVDAARTSVVTSRLDMKAALWVGDAVGEDGAEIVPPAPFGGSLARVVWAGDRVLYDSDVNGRAVIAAIAAGGGAPEEVVSNAFGVSATPSGDTIVFMKASEGSTVQLAKVDAAARQPAPFVEGDAFWPRVSPDGRNVAFESSRGGQQSPWLVPIEGGEPTQITAEFAGAGSVDISPDGRRLLFMSSGDANRFSLVVCDLPDCANRRDIDIGSGVLNSPHWTPDGREVAYVEDGGTNVWAFSLEGGSRHPLTHFAAVPGRKIADYAWSRDGRRLAVLRETSASDIVLLRLRP
jgi:Tol biopolymer transport system component